MHNITIQQKEPIVLTCKRCQNVWEYHGSNPYVATCSYCKTTVSVRKQKVATSGQTLAGTNQIAATIPELPSAVKRGDSSGKS